jgi:hypothetical protein
MDFKRLSCKDEKCDFRLFQLTKKYIRKPTSSPTSPTNPKTKAIYPPASHNHTKTNPAPLNAFKKNRKTKTTHPAASVKNRKTDVACRTAFIKHIKTNAALPNASKKTITALK